MNLEDSHTISMPTSDHTALDHPASNEFPIAEAEDTVLQPLQTLNQAQLDTELQDILAELQQREEALKDRFNALCKQLGNWAKEGLDSSEHLSLDLLTMERRFVDEKHKELEERRINLVTVIQSVQQASMLLRD
ncbi:hypothetical protein BCR37DRAFT_378488 [Protomyces lactucae-debilis]|uniref:Uncharacterized protein n=1 Tax=Protomyces lactucae-debilis TaxID=2754530 RepID=A0A1Y2FP13_PROLT|nr:uncharacterized protein BCR37DRAFT_378488 [Protomyces lactucae-debilis]ORY84455.1 hypothetical protein BCR37DRAFT_378488 [Protomyces lactucae-debilis]